MVFATLYLLNIIMLALLTFAFSSKHHRATTLLVLVLLLFVLVFLKISLIVWLNLQRQGAFLWMFLILQYDDCQYLTIQSVYPIKSRWLPVLPWVLTFRHQPVFRLEFGYSAVKLCSCIAQSISTACVLDLILLFAATLMHIFWHKCHDMLILCFQS